MQTGCVFQGDWRQAGFTPRSKPWDSLAVLDGLGRAHIALDDEELSQHVFLFENDMVAEHDSQHFSRLLERLRVDGVEFSPEFAAFERVWRRDEWNHYIGYRRLFSMLYGRSDDDLHEEVTSRSVDFEPVMPFLGDEFAIAMVLAYDEIVTTRSCIIDYDLFRRFGPPPFLDWIKRVACDEGFHFWNLLRVIQMRHAHRVAEAPAMLDRFIEWDLTKKGYAATFVLDHEDGERFTPVYLERCAALIERMLGLQPRGSLSP